MKEGNTKVKNLLAAGLAAILLLTGTNCQSRGDVFGAPIDANRGTAVDMPTIFADTARYEGKNIILRGTTGQICLAAGCWLMLTDGTNQLFVQFYNFTARPPVRSPVRVQGVLKTQNKVPFLAAEGMEILR